MKDWDDLVSDVKEMKSDIKVLVKDSATNTADLKHHMARTEASEKRLDNVERFVVGLLSSILLTVVYYLLRH